MKSDRADSAIAASKAGDVKPDLNIVNMRTTREEAP